MSNTTAYILLALIAASIVALNVSVYCRNKKITPEERKMEEDKIEEETWPYSM